MTNSYFDTVRPSYLENWPDALHRLSVASTDVPLTLDEARRLGTNIMELGEGFCATDADRQQNAMAHDWIDKAMAAGMAGLPEPPNKITPAKVVWKRADIDDIRDRVREAVALYPPAGTFIRLGSRSPKDSFDGHRTGFCTKANDDPLRFILDASERMYEDLTLAIQQKYSPHIWVRQWLHINPWQEFRCFMQGRKLVGISQYNYLRGHVEPAIAADHDAIDWAIRDLFFPTFKDASHLADVVFDVAVNCWHRRDNTREWEVKLLEINPFFNMTDPCLFSWRSGFDGSFRYNESIKES